MVVKYEQFSLLGKHACTNVPDITYDQGFFPEKKYITTVGEIIQLKVVIEMPQPLG